MASTSENRQEDIFYRPGEALPSELSKDPFKACITPRPIGWISVSRTSDQERSQNFMEDYPSDHQLIR